MAPDETPIPDGQLRWIRLKSPENQVLALSPWHLAFGEASALCGYGFPKPQIGARWTSEQHVLGEWLPATRCQPCGVRVKEQLGL